VKAMVESGHTGAAAWCSRQLGPADPGSAHTRGRGWAMGVLVCCLTLVGAGGVTRAAADTLSATAPLTWWDIRLAPDIPHSRDVLGYDFGAQISSPEAVVRYLEALHAAAPARTRLVEYARSWQGRPLHYLVIGTEDSISRLEDIKADMRRLADPRTLAVTDQRRLLDTLPAIVWLAHGVHGNEVTPSDSALATAYHLLAGAEDPTVRELLAQTVVVIDPLQNPDGRARFLHHYQSLAGLEPQASPLAAERSERWPSGRTNHYLFDMNRDWFVQTQPEVQGRIRTFLEFYPTLHIDLHEMSTDSTFYFPPPAAPHNPHLASAQMTGYELIGQEIAARFDVLGYRYFTRETYDAFYPGYGDTWPSLQGSIGMTFEMASPRGLAGRDRWGGVVTFHDGVARHFAASFATIEAAARHRRALLEGFLEQRRGLDGRLGFVLPRTGDVSRVDRLAALLAAQGVEVRRADSATRLCGEAVPVGSFVIDTAQPAGRLATTLLAPESPADPAFWAEQERRSARREAQEVYDVVAWSLPQLFDVPLLSCTGDFAGYPLVTGLFDPPAPPSRAGVAYLVPWGSRAAAQFLTAALREDIRLDAAMRPFSQGERAYGTGTLIVRNAVNGPDLHERIERLVQVTGAQVDATDASWIDAGVDFGSRHVHPVRAPRIALGWGRPADVLSAGALRFAIERKLGFPVTPVWMEDLGTEELNAFDVLVLPDGRQYGALFEGRIATSLAAWVRQGGTLVAVGGAAAYLGEDGAGLLATGLEARVPDAAGPESANREAGTAGRPGMLLTSADDYAAAIAPAAEPPPQIHGVLLNAVVDTEHWLAAGMPARTRFMFQGDRIFAPLRLDQGANVMTWAAGDALVAGGYLPAAAGAQLERKPALLLQAHGRGWVIGFVADPGFRGMMDGLDVLLANALFFAPAQASPVPAEPWLRRLD